MTAPFCMDETESRYSSWMALGLFFRKIQQIFWAAPHNGARRFGQCFDTSECMKNAGILDVFPIFRTARLGQKIRRSPQSPPKRCCLRQQRFGTHLKMYRKPLLFRAAAFCMVLWLHNPRFFRKKASAKEPPQRTRDIGWVLRRNESAICNQK